MDCFIILTAIPTLSPLSLFPLQGGLPCVREVNLLDSLYAEFIAYNAFVDFNVLVGRFWNNSGLSRAEQFRLNSIYTDHGGTDGNNRVFAANITAFLKANNISTDFMLFDDTYDTLPLGDYYQYSIIVKRSELAHDDVPRYYFQILVETISLDSKVKIRKGECIVCV